MRIVLRNNTTRRDAIYVVSAVGFKALESEYWVTGYWGHGLLSSSGTMVLKVYAAKRNTMASVKGLSWM